MKRRFRFGPHQSWPPPGYVEADDIALTAACEQATARFITDPKVGVHVEECIAWDPTECICTGGYRFVDDYDAAPEAREPFDGYWAGVERGYW